jgi:PAS domain S-box-containing protein
MPATQPIPRDAALAPIRSPLASGVASHSRNRGRTRLLFIGAGLVILGMAILAGWMSWDARRGAEANALRSAQNVTKALAHDIEHIVDTYDLSLNAVLDGLKLANFTSLSPEMQRAVLFDRATEAAPYGAIRVIDATGAVLIDSSSTPQPAASVADRTFFRRHLDDPHLGLLIGAPVRDERSGEWVLTLSRRIDGANGEFAGVVVGTLHLAYLRQMFESVMIDQDAVLSLFKTDGTAILRIPFSDDEVGRDRSNMPVLARLAEHPVGSFSIAAIVDSVYRLYAYRKIGNQPLVISFGQSYATMFAEWRQKTLMTALLILGLIGIAGLLGRALGTELRRRSLAEATASESERRLLLLAENATDVILSIGPDRRMRYVSPASREILGYPPEEMVGAPLLDYVDAEDAPRVAALLERLAGEGAGADRAIDTYRLRRRNGMVIWIEAAFRLAVTPDGDAADKFVATLRDVTARKAAEEALAAKHATLSEILREMPDGIQIYDSSGNMIAWNEQLFDLSDVGPEDRDAILAAANPGRAFRYCLARRGDYGPGDPDELVAAREATARARQPVHFRRLTATGRWLEVHATPTAEGGWLGSYRDVTKEVAREHELQFASKRLEEQAAALRCTAEDLARAREIAEAASRSKSAFLANMSHELRTPLNGVIGFAELMAYETFGPLGDPRYGEYARDIVASGRHLLELINDILDFSKIDAGKLELQEEEIDLHATVAAAVRMLRPRAQEAALTLKLVNDLPPELSHLRADERRLKQIVLNLGANAVKFTPPGGRVAVTLAAAAAPDAAGVVIRVTDTGIGIAAADLPRVLEPFAQIDHGLNRRHEGTGLGLPLTRRLIELHGGVLRLESELGIGTAVTVWLPQARIRPAPATVTATNVRFG